MSLAGPLLLIALAAARPPQAADEPEWERVEVKTVASAGGAVYLDHGRDRDIEPGDEVRLFPEGAPVLLARAAAVSRTSTRVEVDAPPPVGTRGEVRVPRARRTDAPAGAPAAMPRGDARALEAGAGTGAGAAPSVPPHPPWKRAPEVWSEDLPLLAPVRARAARERERRVRADVRVSVDALDASDGRTYVQARSGIDWSVENASGRGDTLRLEADAFARRTEHDGARGDEHESSLRLDRASWRLGGQRGEPTRLELGRFLPSEFPELGVLDGVELVRRLPSGDRVGASLGYLPEPDDFFRSGEDLSAALFYRWVSDESERLSLGGGFQKTWHEGSPDRDLVFANLESRLGARTFLYSSAWLDLYTADDEPKSSGLELTRFLLNCNHRTEAGHGIGLFVSHFRFALLERDELPSLLDEQIADDHVTRVGVNGRWVAGRDTTLSGRVEHWIDEDDRGGSASARVAVRDVLFEAGQVGAEVYTTRGSFQSGLGLRTFASKELGRGWLDLSLDVRRLEPEVDSSPALTNQVLRAAYDTALGENWSLALYLETRFGDEPDSLGAGVTLHRRFR